MSGHDRRIESAQRTQLKLFGLLDFETLQECRARQTKLVRQFSQGRRPSTNHWSRCESDHCACDLCLDGCWFATRRYRFQTITAAYSLLSTHPGELWFVSVAHPKWERPIGKLSEASINAVRQWIYRRFKRLDEGVTAVGALEFSLNVELNGATFWAGHVHLVVAGANKSDLKEACQLENRYRTKSYVRPVDIRQVHNLGRQLGYSLKRFAQRRLAYIDEQGRQNRRALPLTSLEQREFDRWLLGLPVGARTILFGCRLHGSQLRLVKASET